MKNDIQHQSSLNSQTCHFCGEKIIGKRRDAKFCSASCRQQHHLEKKEGPFIREIAKTSFNIPRNVPEKHQLKMSQANYENLMRIKDPSGIKKHADYLSLLENLDDVKTQIEKLFTFESNEFVSQEELMEFFHEVTEKSSDIKKKNHKNTSFLINLYSAIEMFIRFHLSEMKLTNVLEIQFKLNDDLKQMLIKYHSQIEKKMEL
jgi:hypothetical protein